MYAINSNEDLTIQLQLRRNMLTFWAPVLICSLLSSFVACSPDVAAPVEISALQRMYGEAAAEGYNLHRYLDVVETTCLANAKSTALCLSCESLAEQVNAFACCSWEPVYAQCQPIVQFSRQSSMSTVQQFAPRAERSYLGKRYRNRFLGKRSDLEKVPDDLKMYEGLVKDFENLQKRGKMPAAGGRRTNKFLGKRVLPYGKRRNTFLGKRYASAPEIQKWNLREPGREAGNVAEENTKNDMWKK